jgi:RNA polymerase sigma factor (sigma-70 family)
VIFPELTREREAVVARHAVAGDGHARDELVAGCLPAITAMTRRYRGSSTIGRDELIQAGVLGLLRALKRFDPDRGTPFWAYATWWVRQSMQQLVAELAYPVVLSDRALRELAALHCAQSAHTQAHGGEASTAELAHDCDLPPGHVQRLLAVDRAAGALAPTAGVDDDAYERVERQLTSAQLRDLPGGLSERERDVVRSHFGLGQPSRTLDEIAVTLGVTGERVRQIETHALEKVRGVAVWPAHPPARARQRRGTSRATPARSGARALR